MAERTHDCIVVGGGPAGLMLGLLLARAGVRTAVLERHGDFLRDFRGDTIHPSTQQLLHEIGLLERFLALPHADLPQVSMRFSGRRLVLADFSRLPTVRQCIAFMPQWDFLDLLADAGREQAAFDLRMRCDATALLRDGERVVGVVADAPEGPVELRARLTVLADGRDSRLRSDAGLEPVGAPSAIDVLWFRVPREPGESVTFMQLGDGALLSIDRGDFFQAAHIVRRGAWRGDEASLAALRRRVGALEPSFAARLAGLRLDDVRVLRVRIDRLPRWYRDGLLAIGDAAHAMSPAGGVGINLAIQDAVAAANALGPRLASARPSEALLHRIQRRREPPARIVQAVQRRLETMLVRVAEPGTRVPVPLPLRVVQRVPALRHLLGRFIGLGPRPEHATR
ncbi:FAD-dependent oxidoreductase [Agrococcus sp. TF02-05]|uniref:FAD-dependent oxidoreductase n=1 Tax=Agrococcus sp. TF02-05 TaxID=2815211 RepID=UPI001AA0E3C0|nr:FAD-dependent oxidoreductase [Agrococcus sp. TF02-05]MBO1768824.1 FAD-dependent oxidoreductase [Agrococcus sp. TF02-05]